MRPQALVVLAVACLLPPLGVAAQQPQRDERRATDPAASDGPDAAAIVRTARQQGRDGRLCATVLDGPRHAPLLALLVAEPMPANDRELLQSDRLRVLVLTGADRDHQHPAGASGCPAARQAIAAWVGELAGGAHSELLERLTVAFVPDHEAAVAASTSATGLAATARLLRNFDPHVVLELRASAAAAPATRDADAVLATSTSPNVDDRIARFADRTLLPHVRREVEGAEVGDRQPSGLAPLPADLVDCVALRNRFGVRADLNGSLPLPRRTEVARALLGAFLRSLATHAEALASLCADADAACVRGDVLFAGAALPRAWALPDPSEEWLAACATHGVTMDVAVEPLGPLPSGTLLLPGRQPLARWIAHLGAEAAPTGLQRSDTAPPARERRHPDEEHICVEMHATTLETCRYVIGPKPVQSLEELRRCLQRLAAGPTARRPDQGRMPILVVRGPHVRLAAVAAVVKAANDAGFEDVRLQLGCEPQERRTFLRPY